MGKTATLNIRVNPEVKENAESVLAQLGIPMATAIDMYLKQISLVGGIPFSIVLPKAANSVNADMMSVTQIHQKLEKGYADIEKGNVEDAASAFVAFREKLMKKYKVEITKEALQDMEDIYNYIAIDLLAPDNAMGQYNRIADEILTLDTFPERFRIMDSEPEKRMELRRMLVDNYSVFYTIRDERVIVTDVLYTASDIEARLRGEI